MPSNTFPVQMSSNDLIEAADRLSQAELDRVLQRLVALHVRRRTPSVPVSPPTDEQLIPAEVRGRYQLLLARRHQGTLKSAEHGELLQLTMQIEAVDAAHAEHLATLSRLRAIPLEALLETLGIPAPEPA